MMVLIFLQLKVLPVLTFFFTAHNILLIFSTPAVPSDVFAVVTRCHDKGVTSLDLCPHNSLDALAFIFPQQQTVTNCLVSYDHIALVYI